MTNEETSRFFNDSRAFIQGAPDLRNPEVERWFRTCRHFRNSGDDVVLQIPVGRGKTGLMLELPFEAACGWVLLIPPNMEIRRSTSTAFDVAGRECFRTSTRVLTDVSHGPFTAVLDGRDANIHGRIWTLRTSSSWPAGPTDAQFERFQRQPFVMPAKAGIQLVAQTFRVPAPDRGPGQALAGMKDTDSWNKNRSFQAMASCLRR